MNSCLRRIFPIRIFLLFTILDVLLWFPFPDIVHFAGMSSLFHLLLYALGNDRSVSTILALILIPILIACTILFYIMAKKQHKLVPFLVLVGIDLLISFILFFYKIAIGNFLDLFICLSGYILRFVFFLWMIRHINKIQEDQGDI